MITKAVVLARGMGSRMRRPEGVAALSVAQTAAAEAGAKAMMPLPHAGGDRPFLDFVLSALADAGLEEVCLVVAPDHAAMRAYYEHAVSPERLRITFAVQVTAAGTADALRAARGFVGDEDFLSLNGDNYYPVEAYRALIAGPAPALIGFDREALIRESNIDRAKIRAFALLRVDADGFLRDIVEKPDEQEFARIEAHALVSMNLWSFTPRIFDACDRLTPSPRGELELPNAVRLAIRELGMRFRVERMEAGVLDLSNRSDVARVSERLHDTLVRL